MPKYDVIVRPVDGNGMSVIAAVAVAMRKGGATPVEVGAYTSDAMSGDYDHLLRVSMEMVDLRPSNDDEDDEGWD